MAKGTGLSSPFWGIPNFWKPARDNVLGDIWDSSSASKAFERGDIKSKSNGDKVRLAFRNATPFPLLLCWVNQQGVPKHFYELEPFHGSVDDIVTIDDKIESSFCGHSFVLAYCGDNLEKAAKQQKLDPKTIIGGYRPNRLTLNETEDVDEEYVFHVVTITHSQVDCCRPWGHLRGGPHHPYTEDGLFEWHVAVKEGIADSEPIDTSNKKYDEETIFGWPVRFEPGMDKVEPKLKETVKKDLKAVSLCLPLHARNALRKDTCIFVNISQKFGPKVCPVDAKACCFHPGEDWLIKNGMSPKKKECVEIYCASDYLKSRELWGTGGLLMHELSHAYHWKVLEDRYDNEVIDKCYQAAMKDGLYDSCAAHGHDAPERAYAASNRMEYFAELSAAFLGGLNKKKEFNKWFPFNRAQIEEHDPRAFAMLQRMWKVEAATEFSI